MAARVLLQRRAAAPLTATLLAGVALYPAVAHAEAPADDNSRKPIYDDLDAAPPPSSLATTLIPSALVSDTTTTTTTPSPSRPQRPTPTDRLAAQIGRARLALYRGVSAAEDGVNGAMARAFDLEQSFTSTVASLAPPRESGERLMPGAIYVLVAAMAGSILTRRSNFVLRAAAPLALGVGAGWVVLPLTMRNVADLTWRAEQRFPAVANAHLSARDGVEKGVGFARVHAQVGRQYVEDKVQAARGTVEDWVRKGK